LAINDPNIETQFILEYPKFLYKNKQVNKRNRINEPLDNKRIIIELLKNRRTPLTTLITKQHLISLSNKANMLRVDPKNPIIRIQQVHKNNSGYKNNPLINKQDIIQNNMEELEYKERQYKKEHSGYI
jgi:hypothetical protein